LQDATGSWHGVFLAATLTNFAVVLLAVFVLKPMRAGKFGALATLRTTNAQSRA
jgi:MFS transporter, OFA family, oxalate/formate antiporter